MLGPVVSGPVGLADLDAVDTVVGVVDLDTGAVGVGDTDAPPPEDPEHPATSAAVTAAATAAPTRTRTNTGTSWQAPHSRATTAAAPVDSRDDQREIGAMAPISL